MGTPAEFLVEHWQLALGAAALGFILALAHLAAEYFVAPAWRLRTPRRRGPGAIEALVTKKQQRLRRLENEAAVSSEHGRPEVREIWEETQLRPGA